MNFNRTAVIYDQDPDGFGCYYTARKNFGDRADYYEVLHGTELPDVDFTDYDNVYIFDLCFDDDIMLSRFILSGTIVIDHHPSARKTVETFALSPVPFDTTRAACVQVWEYLHPDKEVPLILQYVADRDVWAFEMDDSEAINAYISIHDTTIRAWDELNYDLKYGYEEVVKIGSAVNAHKGMLAREMADMAVMITVDGYDIPLTAAPVLHSEVGHELLDKYPDAPFVMTYNDYDLVRKYSMRSEDHREDVGELASKAGGGGHHNAAGFSLSHSTVWEGQRELYDVHA